MRQHPLCQQAGLSVALYEDTTLAGRLKVMEMSASDTTVLAPDTALLNFSYLLAGALTSSHSRLPILPQRLSIFAEENLATSQVYTKSRLAEQTTPSAVAIEDNAASVTGLRLWRRS